MTRTTANSRVSLSPTEREIVTSMFELLVRELQGLRISEEDLVEAVVENTNYAGDIDYPEELREHVSGEEIDEWGWVERERAKYRREIAPQAIADVAADFGVELRLEGTENKKWCKA